MFLRMLKKDFKRKKTINAILLLFIILAAMFMASGINNVVTVMNGTDYYLEKAGVGDFNVITMGQHAVGALDEMLATEEAVKDYHMENVVFSSQDSIKSVSGEKLIAKNTTIFQPIEDAALTFFDRNNEELKEPLKGHVCITGNFIGKNDLKTGDKIRVKISNAELVLTIDGKAKDALLGSDFMGNTRFLLNQEDYRKILSADGVRDSYEGQICYIDTDDVGQMTTALSNVSNVAFSGGRSVIKMCYVMDMIVAFITLILSICLIIVSFVVLKFSITFTITGEYREIGVMKAIGIRNFKIRSMYISKYLCLAVIGAMIGFLCSIPFGKLLLKFVSENMVLANDYGFLINLSGAVIVILTTIFFAFLCTGKVKKVSPLDAIRSGETGERYKKKSIYRLGKSHTGTSMYLALNDVLSSPKRFLTIIITFFLCTLFVLIIVNTSATMRSPNLITSFATKSDLYVTDVDEAMRYMQKHTKEDIEKLLRQKEEDLENEGMPAKMCIEVQYKYPVDFRGKEYSLSFQQGVGTKADDYEYIEGTIPERKDEIAITPAVSKLIGAKIGDSLTVHFADGDLKCIVTAYFETMNLLGEVIRLHEDAPVDMEHCASMMSYQINFTDAPDAKEIADRKAKIKKLYHNDDVMDAAEYCADCIGVVDMMETVQHLLLVITFVAVVLVTILMERTFVAGEVVQIAILKAIGFKDRAVIRWHVYRFGIAAFLSVFLAAVLSIPMTKLCVTPIFGMMGATKIHYHIDILKVFLLYPGSVFAVTILSSYITSLHTGKIKSSDTANIE